MVPQGARTPLGRWLAPLLAVWLVTVAAYFPQWLGWTSCNPIYSHAGLVAHAPSAMLPGGCTLDGNDGGTLQALGGTAAEAWLHGDIPWWNAYAGLGLPLAAEAQPAVFFLPFVLLLHFTAGLLLLKVTMQLLAGALALAALREMGVARAGAATGAVLFALNGSFAWFAHSMILPIAFLPALVFGIERCRRLAVAGEPGGQIAIGLALAFSLAAGFPETAFMDGLLAGLWAVCAVLGAPGARLALLGKIAMGGLAGLALSAPAWLSFLDYLRVSSVAAHGFVSLNHLAADQAATMILPDVFGTPYGERHVKSWTDDGGYFGPSMTVLALLALAGMRRGGGHALLRGALAAWIAFWLAAFLGEPVSHALWRAAPLLNQVQITRYAMPSLEFAACILAALAVEDWSRAPARRAGAWAAAGFASLAIIACAAAFLGGRIDLSGDLATLFAGWASIEAGVAVGLLVWLVRRPRTQGRARALAVLVVLDASAHFVLPQLAGTRPDRLALAPLDYLRAHGQFSRIYAIGEQVPVNYAGWFGVAGIQADSVPGALQWVQAAGRIGGLIDVASSLWPWMSIAQQAAQFSAHQDGLARAGVRFLVVPQQADPFAGAPHASLSEVYADQRTRIYEIADAAPYFSFVGGPCTLEVSARTEVRTRCAAPAVLIRRELALPGWHARVNGGKSAISVDEGIFQQVGLPAGNAHVQWHYAPPHLRWMVLLFLLGLVLMGIRRKNLLF